VELREALEGIDVTVVYVMASNQINPKARRFLDEKGLAERIRIVSDPESRVIEALGVLRENAEPIEKGVAHPATFVIDRSGHVRLADVRTDFQIWIDPTVLRESLESID